MSDTPTPPSATGAERLAKVANQRRFPCPTCRGVGSWVASTCDDAVECAAGANAGFPCGTIAAMDGLVRDAARRAALAGEPEGTTNSPETDTTLVVPAPTVDGSWLTMTDTVAAQSAAEIAEHFEINAKPLAAVEHAQGWLREAVAQRVAKGAAERDIRIYRHQTEAITDRAEKAESQVATLTAKLEAAERERTVAIADAAELSGRVAELTATVAGLRELAREAFALAQSYAGDGCHLSPEFSALRARLAALDGQKEGSDATD